MPPSATVQAGDAAYARRVPEETILYGVVREQLETFLAHAQSAGRSVPKFVEREMRAYLQFGILTHGFVRVHCDGCGHDRLVAFSCKGRGFCPSCGGRVSQRRRARSRLGPGAYRCGAITFVQRFGDALNLNLHFHTLVLDGVFVVERNGSARFRAIPPPTDSDIERSTRRIARSLRRLLIRNGMSPDADGTHTDTLAADEPFLADIYAASVRSRVALGRRTGRAVLRIGDLVDPEQSAFLAGPRCTSIDGVSLHANVSVPARDRRRLEKLCRYVARPPVATGRLSRLDDGRLLYKLKRRWRDGTTHVVFEPLELVEKIASIIPPPRFHLVRYHGVFAPRASCRAQAVGRSPRPFRDALPAKPPSTSRAASPCSPARPVASTAHARKPSCEAPDRGRIDSPRQRPSATGDRTSGQRRIPWAELMRRVFAVDVLQCPSCRAPMRILAVIHPPKATRKILESMHFETRAPPLEPSRLPGAEA